MYAQSFVCINCLFLPFAQSSISQRGRIIPNADRGLNRLGTVDCQIQKKNTEMYWAFKSYCAFSLHITIAQSRLYQCTEDCNSVQQTVSGRLLHTIMTTNDNQVLARGVVLAKIRKFFIRTHFSELCINMFKQMSKTYPSSQPIPHKFLKVVLYLFSNAFLLVIRCLNRRGKVKDYI